MYGGRALALACAAACLTAGVTARPDALAALAGDQEVTWQDATDALPWTRGSEDKSVFGPGRLSLDPFMVGGKPGFLLNSGFDRWLAEQQLLLDSLHSLFEPRPRCGHAALPPPLDGGLMVPYMATSRFGPLIVTTVMREGEGFVDVLIDWDGVDARPAAPQPREQAAQAIFGSDGDARPLPLPLPAEAQEARWEPSVVLERHAWTDEGASGNMEPRTLFVAGRAQDVDTEPRSFSVPPRPGAPEGLPWGPIVSVVLMAACAAVWVAVLRAWGSCCAAQAQAQASGTHTRMCVAKPLLDPLVGAARLEAGSVAVAAAHAPAGEFFAPAGSQFVRVAYVPLRSEQ